MSATANIVGQITKGTGALVAGRDAQAAGDFEAAQLRRSGKAVMASAISEAQNEERRAKLLASRATALAAASGASASDPGAVKIIGDIKGEGAYRASYALYAGESKQAQLKTQANAKSLEGKQTKQASIISAIGEFAKAGPSVGTLYDKYSQPPDLTGLDEYTAHSGGIPYGKNEFN